MAIGGNWCGIRFLTAPTGPFWHPLEDLFAEDTGYVADDESPDEDPAEDQDP
eukprot:SAG22_NODE_15910_length_337_cov_0.840336_1_plen_51_part_10